MRLILCLGWLAAAAAAGDSLSDEQRAALARHFGFGPMEIYKVKPGISNLRLADLNGDGRTDVVLWNSNQSRIELFLQPDPEKPAAARKTSALDQNEVPDRGSLRRENVPVAYRVASMEVADVSGDGHADIVFFGEPKELVVLAGDGTGGFGPPSSIRTPEGDPRSGSLAVGDFNSDGRTDVALLGQNVLLLFHQKPEGGLGKPVRLVHNVSNTLLMLPADLNGDGRADLIVGVDHDEYGVFAILQDASGAAGAMQRVRVPKLRSLTVARAPGGDDVFSVEASTGRLKHFRWETRSEAAGEPEWPLWVYSFPITSRSKRQPLALGDVNGDGRVDVVSVDPDAAQMILFLGDAAGLQPGVAMPALLKTVDVCIGDVDGDGRDEVVTVSTEEKMIGVSRFEHGRLTFPAAHPALGEVGAKPLAATIARLRPDGPPMLAYVVSEKVTESGASDAGASKRDGREVNRLHVVTPDGTRSSCDVGELKDDVAGLRAFDVDQDGLLDLLLFVRFSPLVTLLQRADGTFERFEGPASRSELVKDAPLEGFATADVNGDRRPELLLAQKTMVRALAVRGGRWEIVDQFNPENADADVVGAAALAGLGPPSADGAAPESLPMLALYDRKGGDLQFLTAERSGAYRVVRTMPVGAFELQGMHAAPLGRDGRTALLLADTKKLALVGPQQAAAGLVEKHSYETDVKDGSLFDAAVGDVNGDGVRDVVAMESRRGHLEVLTTLPDGELARALTFQVFQGKRFRRDFDVGGEPREIMVGDVNADGVDDVVLIVHDRVIVYPGQ